MKIALVGPGIIPIPPPGWGGVEVLVWDYFKELELQGHAVTIVNIIGTGHGDPSSNYIRNLIETINSVSYDFVHIHYDVLHHIIPYLTAHRIAITSHYPNLGDFEKHASDNYESIFRGICNNTRHYIFAPSKRDRDLFARYCVDPSRVALILNSTDHRAIDPVPTPENAHKSINVGKVEWRKQQHRYYVVPGIDFYGKCDNNFKFQPCYKGEPSRDDLLKLLPTYGNLVHLSASENATPLVVKEALMAGLPIVTNKWSMADLEPNLPFIDVIPDDKLDDMTYIENVIRVNLTNQSLKDDIRRYAYENFSTEKVISKYISEVANMQVN